jgi:hypothetical protein
MMPIITTNAEPEGVPPVPDHIRLDHLDLLQCGLLPAVISANLEIVGLVMFDVSHLPKSS